METFQLEKFQLLVYSNLSNCLYLFWPIKILFHENNKFNKLFCKGSDSNGVTFWISHDVMFKCYVIVFKFFYRKVMDLYSINLTFYEFENRVLSIWSTVIIHYVIERAYVIVTIWPFWQIYGVFTAIYFTLSHLKSVIFLFAER